MSIIQALEQSPFLFYLTVCLLGLLVGSFLNVVAYRLPIMLQNAWRQECLAFLEQEDTNSPSPAAFNLSQPRSRCPSCQHPISALENIPVLSYLFLQGRCKNCQQAISIRYPAVELITALLSLLIAVQFGVSLQMCVALLFTWALISLTLIDLDTQLLPDSITLPLLWFALSISLFEIFITPKTALIGALAGYLSLWSVFWLFKLITGKEGMGYGDFKLLAAIGALLGWKMLPLVIMLSALAGAIIGITLIIIHGRDKNIPIPFGPYLSIAAFIALIWGEKINLTYLQFVGL
ncbi:MAG: leader peptidase (prepilin peptidase)/N-methyltransferase [Cycloclasticus pugetii]|jgi:leader peptidase (prepilin peptidase)/N-methyltransferase|uniref:prepilin peptidase n=1 Tax=Cycloclasticus pugetii TaxID=34068 RepID=UPI0039E4CAEF